MRLTQARAREITLEVWRHLADHPEIRHKDDLPPKIYENVKTMTNECPLCERFFYEEGRFCRNCPLYKGGEYCNAGDSAYELWRGPESDEIRISAARRIVEIVEAWKPRGVKKC